MRAKLFLLILITGILYCTMQANAQSQVKDHAILVDSSGSMDGFFNTGSIRMLVLNLQKILGGARLYFFSDSGPKLVNSAEDLYYIKGDTRIDLALQGVLESPRPDAVWMITDNIQDRSETPYIDASTKEFYDILKQEDVAKIYIMPCFLDFDGKSYVNREGRQYAEKYTGRKGLIVYGILLKKMATGQKQGKRSQDDAYIKQFDDLTDRFEKTLIAYESKLLLAKPLDKATFDLKPSDQPAGNEKPSVRLNEKGIFFGKDFREGKKIPVVFYVNLLSKFEDLIVSGKVNASVIDGRFTSTGFKDARVNCTIFPEKVDINPGEMSGSIYKITININKVKMRTDPLSILRASLGGKPGEVEGIVRLEVQVPREGFRFIDEVLKKYNTDDIEDYKRIYGMGSLINYMPADVTRIPIDYKIVLAVNYPYWPMILVILFVVFDIIVIYVVFRSYSSMRGVKFAVSVDNEAERIIPLAPLFGSYKITKEGKVHAAIYKSMGGEISVRANKGSLIDGALGKKRLNRDMDSFNISDQYVNINVHFRSLKEDTIEKDSDLDAEF